MKTQARASKQTIKANACDRIKDDAELVCFKCGIKGHHAKSCRQKTWCSQCKTDTHKDTTCRCKDKPDRARKIAEDGDSDFAFKVRDEQPNNRRQDTHSIREQGLMVDTGATSHITNVTKFKSFQEKFKPENYSVELADSTKCSGVALKRGDLECYLIDNRGQQRKAALRNALFIPSYPQDIFSGKAATSSGATVLFKEDVTEEDLHPVKHDPPYVIHEEEVEMPYIKQEVEPGTPYIKEEKQEDEITNFPMIVSVKSEEDEGLSEESGAAKPSSHSSFQHVTTKDITVQDLYAAKHDPPYVKQESERPYIKQEAELEPPSIKKEKQEDEITKFAKTVSVKSEEDPSEENGAAKRSSDSSFQHLTTKDITVEELHPEKHYPAHVKLEEDSVMPYVKQEAEPETPYIKEEYKENEITTFPMTFSVKSEESEGPSKESETAQHLSDCSFQHLEPKAGKRC
ncbi:uncharacterized protein LOC130910793 [Corythoichthys intestinalis]|uniref:uncharacterized protein LOC130910793 n=1 Tax=Corythoichthys intestinalis TaxID=161448 RepID=UPI0025A4DDF1|nr:uncharacterized protein LOC130910793 [Corythoichthys intestinalis]